MTPGQGAALVWALGLALSVLAEYRRTCGLVDADPLMLCDECRDERRETVMSLQVLPAPLYVLLSMITAAAWPITAPGIYGLFVWDLIQHRWFGGPSPWCQCPRAVPA